MVVIWLLSNNTHFYTWYENKGCTKFKFTDKLWDVPVQNSGVAIFWMCCDEFLFSKTHFRPRIQRKQVLKMRISPYTSENEEL